MLWSSQRHQVGDAMIVARHRHIHDPGIQQEPTARRTSCNSVAMRVQGPPSKCKSDSVSPRSATGSQGSEAGINGGAWQPHAGYPVEQASMGSASEGVWSHRDHDPAQEAEALEPKGTG